MPRRIDGAPPPALLLVLALSLVACNQLTSVMAGSEATPAPPAATALASTPPTALASMPPTPEDEASRTPPAEPLPTAGPTITPPATAALYSAPPTHTPATPCTTQSCASAAAHFWLERPIPADQGFVNYVDRSYPYASTQGGFREPHHGVEFFNGGGTPIIAAAAGTVVVAGDDSTTAYGPATSFYGNLVVIELDQAYDGQPVFNLYGHMLRVDVAVGDEVEAGDLLGAVGSTGVAIGAHLHFEVRVGRNDYASTRNPELWFRPLAVDGRPWGIIAGRVVDPQGNLVPEATVVIRPVDTDSDRPRNRFVLTYSDLSDSINGDDRLQENFAISDVPTGTYMVSVNTTKLYQQSITVRSNQITWVVFVVNPPGPRPPTPLPETATALALTAFAPPATETPADAPSPEPATPEPTLVP